MPRLGGGGGPAPQQRIKTPTMLSIIGIACWFWLLSTPVAIVLGMIAQRQYRSQGQRETLAKVAWIGGVVMLVFYIVLIALHTHTGHAAHH